MFARNVLEGVLYSLHQTTMRGEVNFLVFDSIMTLKLRCSICQIDAFANYFQDKLNFR